MHLKTDVHIVNKKVAFAYFVLEEYVAGIQLFGTEIKSIREGQASLVDAYCYFNNRELWVKQMHIALYRFGSFANHDVKRDRKLLLTRRELSRLYKQTREMGKTIVPTELFIDENGRAKLRIALCKGKHAYDKRNSIREREDKKNISRVMKNIQI